MSTIFRRNVAALTRPIIELAPASTPRCLPIFRRILGRPCRVRVFERRALFHSSVWRLQQAAALSELKPDDFVSQTEVQEQSNDAVTTFEELGKRKLVSNVVVNTIVNVMKLKTMTPVQVQTINPGLKGDDLIAQAKTGTGKTVGFLIPVVQRILANNPELERNRGRERLRPDIKALIISPTRELAEQIAVETRKVVRDTRLKVQTAVGGTQKSRHLQNLRHEGCHILVGTPGRLADVLADPGSGVDVSALDALVLDEADRLLDDGFGPEIERIHNVLLPDKKQKDRQTLMFSATMPREVIHMVRRLMKPGYQFIRTVTENETPTHERVLQKVVETKGLQNLMPTLLELTKREIAVGRENGKPFKAIFFFNANSEASLYYHMFQNLAEPGSSRFSNHPLAGITMVEMHSKLDQRQRTRNSELFRSSRSGIMFSSDVSARGMDFPNVTHVIQVGLARDRETYIHRLGRTARGDKTGEGWLLLNPLDRAEARSKLRGIPLQPDNSLQTAQTDMTRDAQLPARVAEILTQSVQAAKRTDVKRKSEAYRALLGTHQWYRNKAELIESLNAMSKYCWGMETPPAISSVLAARLGLSRIRSLNTKREDDAEGRDDYSSNGRSGGFDRERSQPRRSMGLAARGGSRSFGDRERSFGGRERSYGGDRERPFSDRPPRSFGDRNTSFGVREGGDRARGRY